MTDMTDTVGVAGDRIRSIIERVERLEEEIKDLMEAKKEISKTNEASRTKPPTSPISFFASIKSLITPAFYVLDDRADAVARDAHGVGHVGHAKPRRMTGRTLAAEGKQGVKAGDRRRRSGPRSSR